MYVIDISNCFTRVFKCISTNIHPSQHTLFSKNKRVNQNNLNSALNTQQHDFKNNNNHIKCKYSLLANYLIFGSHFGAQFILMITEDYFYTRTSIRNGKYQSIPNQYIH